MSPDHMMLVFQTKKKVNTYEDTWVKCDVDSKNAHVFPEMIGKRKKS